MIVTSYTRLVMNCHREELGNRFDIATAGFFRPSGRIALPESYSVQPIPTANVLLPLAVGRDAQDRQATEIRGAA